MSRTRRRRREPPPRLARVKPFVIEKASTGHCNARMYCLPWVFAVVMYANPKPFLYTMFRHPLNADPEKIKQFPTPVHASSEFAFMRVSAALVPSPWS